MQMHAQVGRRRRVTSYESLRSVVPLLVISPPVLLASARAACTLRRIVAGASLAWKTVRLQLCRLEETRALVRSMLTLCILRCVCYRSKLAVFMRICKVCKLCLGLQNLKALYNVTCTCPEIPLARRATDLGSHGAHFVAGMKRLVAARECVHQCSAWPMQRSEY